MHCRISTLKVGLFLLVAASNTVIACKDKAKCEEALKTARQAMQDEYLDMELARKWRDHAGKICGQGTELQTLDKEILDREAALVKAAEEAAQKAKAEGEKAIEQAAKLWKKWDKLEDKEKDKSSLKKTYTKARKLVIGLTPDYAKQVEDYNKKRYKSRQAQLEKDKK